MYLPVDYLRGVWGLEERAYSFEEVRASAHLQAAVNAGALTRDTADEERDIFRPNKAAPRHTGRTPTAAESKED